MLTFVSLNIGCASCDPSIIVFTWLVGAPAMFSGDNFKVKPSPCTGVLKDFKRWFIQPTFLIMKDVETQYHPMPSITACMFWICGFSNPALTPSPRWWLPGRCDPRGDHPAKRRGLVGGWVGRLVGLVAVVNQF